MNLQLNDKVALVTGSSKGIGEAIVRALAREGATVVVHGRDEALAAQVAGSIITQGGRAHFVVGDLTEDGAVAALADEAERLAGEVGILVNNAGGSGPKNDWKATELAEWTSTYDRNVLAAVRVTTRFLPRMRQARWGRVINISSGAAVMPPPIGPDYSAAKAAMNAMTASMAKAVAADGVTVNAISPGPIRSAKLEAAFRTAAAERGLVPGDAPWEEIERDVLHLFAQVPVGRVGGCDDIASAVAYLASPIAGFITGVNLRVDGGSFPGL